MSNNILSNNYVISICLRNSKENIIANNTISKSSLHGISLEENSSNNIVTSNRIFLNAITAVWGGAHSTGIDLPCLNYKKSNYNIITGNSIANCSWGINLYYGDYNQIYHNNFINSTEQAYNYNGTNIWDNGYPSGGNYWSNYTGEDKYSGPCQDQPGSDGIGDTPYPIPKAARDKYPYMSENGWRMQQILPVHNLNTEENFSTIQAAIDDNDTKDGHTITVYSGVYNENVVVNKSVTLIGNGQPVVDASGWGSAITLTADGITLIGFTATNSGRKIDAGITVTSSNNIITGNTVSNNDDGIRFWYSSNNIITSNNVSNNDNGIYLEYSNNNTITDNTFFSNDVGIHLSDSSNNNTIAGNNVRNNRDGIALRNSSNNKIYLSNLINNTDNVYSHKSTNIWKSTEKITYTYNGSTYTNYLGNYWGDYEEKYPDADAIDTTGIWDTPYSIAGDKENYPLLERFENYCIIGSPIVHPPATEPIIAPGDNFTEFYILCPNGTASGYPTNLTVGEDGKEIIGIVNHEYTNVTYQLEVWLSGELIGGNSIALKHNETWESPFTFRVVTDIPK